MREYSDKEKIAFIEKYVDNVEGLPEKDREKYRLFVEEGVRKEWPVALHAMAYGCYGGNEVFEEDWITSRDCLIKLAQLTDDPFAYNTLGYIYYYGRCNGKVPEYEKAFQCFSIGAASGVYESRYKLADMFLAGKGCIQSKTAGANLIMSMYLENRDLFCEKEYECKFADIALRVGGLFERGDGVEQDIEAAYGYYLEANCAIKKRLKYFDYYGDRKVAKGIEESLKRVKDQLPADFFEKEMVYETPIPIGGLLRNSVGMDIVVTEEYGKYMLEAIGFKGGESSGCTMLTIPKMGICELISSVKMSLSDDAKVSRDSLPYRAFVTELKGDEEENTVSFIYGDMMMVGIYSREFRLEGYECAED